MTCKHEDTESMNSVEWIKTETKTEIKRQTSTVLSFIDKPTNSNTLIVSHDMQVG